MNAFHFKNLSIKYLSTFKPEYQISQRVVFITLFKLGPINLFQVCLIQL